MFHSHFCKGDWKWDVYWPGIQICDNGKQIRSCYDSGSNLTRSNYGMSVGTGVYTIKIRLHFLMSTAMGIGVCLKDANLDDQWHCDPKSVVWGMFEDDIDGIEGGIHPPSEDNVFFQKCKVIGGPVPEFVSDDEIQMIYDSNKGEMRFKRNGEYLSSIVKNLNSVGDLYWCVGSHPRFIQWFLVTILN